MDAVAQPFAVAVAAGVAVGMIGPLTREQPFFMDLIGGFRASCAGLDCTFTGRKAQALFVYLAFRKNMIESRERVAGLLWSEKGEEAARVSLRQQISGIRRETEHL